MVSQLLFLLNFTRFFDGCGTHTQGQKDDDTYLHLVMELAEETLKAYMDMELRRYNWQYLEENEVWQIFIEVSFYNILKLEPETRLCGIRSDECI
jgi:hypothetical protein